MYWRCMTRGRRQLSLGRQDGDRHSGCLPAVAEQAESRDALGAEQLRPRALCRNNRLRR